MIDIRTASTDSLARPFDWGVVRSSVLEAFSRTDHGDQCAGPSVQAVVLQEYALCLDDSLHTAVIISLFSDRRASRDVVLPLNQADRRGWCGDEFVSPDDAWGSDLWQCYVTKSVVDVEERARFAAWEALQWMVRSGLAAKVVVETSWTGESNDRLALRPQIFQSAQSGRPDYDVLWGTTLRRAGS